MLVFFMLATNFYEKRDMEFSIEKDISEDSEIKETAIIKIQKNDYFYEDNKINKSKLEEELVIIINNKKFKNFVILNDKSSEIKCSWFI